MVEYADTDRAGSGPLNYYAMVMHRGLADVKQLLESHTLTDAEKMYFAYCMVHAVQMLHACNHAWMDVKPANFLSVIKDNRQFIVGIDLDHALEVRTPISRDVKQHAEVTWAYADPVLAKIMCKHANTPLTARQYDLWSLGITLMELFDNGNSLFSAFGSDSAKIRDCLCTLKQTDVDAYLKAKFSTQGQEAIRSCLTGLLVVNNPGLRWEAARVLQRLEGGMRGGLTDLTYNVNQLTVKVDNIADQMAAMRKEVSSSLARVAKGLHEQLQDSLGDMLRSNNTIVLSELEVVCGRLQGALTANQTKGGAELRAELFATLDASQNNSSAVVVEYVKAVRRELTDTLEASTLGGASAADISALAADVRRHTDDIKAQIAGLSAEAAKNRSVFERMLYTLIKNTHDLPTLFVLLPLIPSERQGVVNRFKNFVFKDVRLYFICSHTLEVVPCGRKGNGYKLSFSRDWVVKAAPVLQVGLMLLQIGLLASTGLPLPVHSLRSSLQSVADKKEYLESAADMLRGATEAVTDSPVMPDTVESCLNCLHLDSEATMQAYETVSGLLKNAHPEFKLTSGMVKETVEGHTAWIRDDVATVDSFKLHKGKRMPSANNFLDVKHTYTEPQGESEAETEAEAEAKPTQSMWNRLMK